MKKHRPYPRQTIPLLRGATERSEVGVSTRAGQTTQVPAPEKFSL